MKAIVANVLFAGIFGCLGGINPARAELTTSTSSSIPHKPLASAKLPPQSKLPAIAQLFGSIDRVMTIDKSNRFNFEVNYHGQVFSDRPNQANSDFPSLKHPYIHQSEQIDLIFGFQNTFWPSQKKQKYWGITTVKLWGQNELQSSSSELNYTNSAPSLATGSSTLTVSGGGNNNLIEATKNSKTNSDSKFEEFRGGISYHHGVAKDLTIGAGFIFDNLWLGFTQFTYESDLLPIRTTLSLLTKDSEINLHSHVHFEPAPNFVVNYYHDEEKQKFDFNWDIVSGLTLLAKGNSKSKSYNTGIQVALSNDYLSLSATATFDRDRNLNWQLNSQIGRFKFIHSSDRDKTSSELNTDLIDSSSLGFECSVFVKYQTREVKKEPEEFMVWGGEIRSTKRVGQNRALWTLNLGYASGERGKGLTINGAVSVASALYLKLDYREISAVSDDTEIKLELSSN